MELDQQPGHDWAKQHEVINGCPGLVAIALAEDERCCYSVSAGLIDERRSRRLPAGLLDQPFYGWVVGGALLRSPLQRAYKLVWREGYGMGSKLEPQSWCHLRCATSGGLEQLYPRSG
jgi:hypothetical protein